MKKLTKLSALLLVAAVFFAGCKTPDDSTGGPSATPLFSESDTTIEINASDIELTDGEWTFKQITNYEDNLAVVELEITVTNGMPTVTKGRAIESGTIPEGADVEKAKEMYAKQGATLTINGNKYTAVGELNAAMIANYNSKFATLIYMFDTVKTNEERTKFFVSETDTYEGETETTKYYLSKK